MATETNRYDNITYMNSGDWVESLSALVEDYFGNWKIIYYSELTDEEKDAGMNGQSRSSLQPATAKPAAPAAIVATVAPVSPAASAAPSAPSVHSANKRPKFKPVALNR